MFKKDGRAVAPFDGVFALPVASDSLAVQYQGIFAAVTNKFNMILEKEADGITEWCQPE